MTGAWLSAAGGAWPWIAQAANPRNTLAVVDPSLAAARALTEDVASGLTPVFETGDDIGALWYGTLAPRLAAAPGLLLIGVTRASDYFVLGELALRSARMVEYHCQRCAGAGAAIAFAMGSDDVRRWVCAT